MPEIPQALPAALAPVTCPVAKTAPAPATEAGAAYQDPLADKFGGKDDTIPCPFWKVAVNEGLVHPDANGNISMDEVRSALTKIGAASVFRETAIAGVKNVLAPMAGIHGALASQGLDHINLLDLRQSPLMHTGDSGILRDGFNQQRLDRLLSYSSDGDRVTLADLAAANKDQVANDPGEHGHVFGTAEYTLLMMAFGETDKNGDKFLTKQDLTTIYKDNKFPDSWQGRKFGFIQTGVNIARFSNDQKKDVADPKPPGHPDSVADARPEDISKAKAAGVCPFLNGQSFTADEAAKQHADVLPQ